jgi:hypothetical protein
MILPQSLSKNETSTDLRPNADGGVGALPAERGHHLGQPFGCDVGLAVDGHTEDGIEEASLRRCAIRCCRQGRW